MFYVKSKIGEEVEVRIDITDENVFTTCPICKKEVHIDDFSELCRVTEIDLFDTTLYCESCSKIQSNINN